MLLQPKNKNTKFFKKKKGRLLKKNSKRLLLSFGLFGIKSLNSGHISSKEIESARQTISRETNRKGKIWIKVFPYNSITSKSTESRMGKGKGSVKTWTVCVKPGMIIFEITGVSKMLAFKSLKTGSTKLSVKTKIF